MHLNSPNGGAADGDVNLQQRRANFTNEPSSSDTAQAFLPQSVASSVGAYVLTTGKQRAQQALNIYSHIDYLRPYFDVEPKDVLNRLIFSLNPLRDQPGKLPTELYGPLMIIFTLSAILIYQMKVASHSIQDGTLIGSAFFVCFTYWIGASFFFSSTSFICNSSVTLFNYLSLIGYSLFSHCIVLLVGTFVHTSFDHFLFYFLWLVLGGAAGVRLAKIIFSNIPHPHYKVPLAVGAIVIHLCFLLYLHFAYHELAEEVSHALFDSQQNLPVRLIDSDLVTSSLANSVNDAGKQPSLVRDRY